MNKILQLATLTAIVLSLGACEDFLDVNDNPNQPVNVPLDLKLPAALVATVNQESTTLNQLGALWGGYWGNTNEASNLFTKEKTYAMAAIADQRDGVKIWENGFNAMLNYQLMLKDAEENNAPYYAGIAKIMLGWHFMRLVDVYDNIPFDDALQGTQHVSPAYEEGEVVYAKSLNLITEGIEDIKHAPSATLALTPAEDDIVFGGDMELWIKFANTVKLRGLIRQSETGNTGFIDTEITEIMAEGSGFLGTGENAFVDPGYLTTEDKQNPFWSTYYKDAANAETGNYSDIRPTTFLIQQYEERNDPRLSTLYVPVNGGYQGVIFGNPATQDDAYDAANTSAFLGPDQHAGEPGALFKSPVQPSVLMSSFESLFLQAEAAQRGWIPGSAREFYEQAIRESFQYMEVPAEAFDAYNAQASVDFSQAADKLARIITQKWLALNSISSIEAWNDYRRLGLPENLPNSLQAPTPTSRPRRLLYPETERNTNGTEVSRQGTIDPFTDGVWWDR